MSNKHQELVGFIWQVADLLRGDYKQSEYGKVILPFTVLRRLDCVLEPTKDAVLARYEQLRAQGVQNVEKILCRVAGHRFYNVSKFTFRGLLADQDNVKRNLQVYIGGFSPGTVEVLEKYDFDNQITRLDNAGLLYQVVAKFAEIDLHPEAVSNHQMGYVFEELIRRFSELSNETAGEHFTPREVIRLMVNLLLAPDRDALATPGIVRKIYDPACGTGGMLTEAQEQITRYNPHATVEVYGQELNPESYAICRSDMLIKGQDPANIAFGNSFSQDGHKDATFDYMLANPPFGVEWKKVEQFIKDEAARGHAGRFGAGLPRINDGSLLFLQHMISKMKRPEAGGTRLAIVFNGSPLFTGGAGSGESEIRRWILENDWLEAIVALPDQLFYNTGISTYFWILTNRKDPAHRGKVILLDARDHWAKMRKSLGEKRKQITEEQIRELTELYVDALKVAEDPAHPLHGKVKVFDRHAFGYQRITVERPLRLRFEVTEDTLAEIEASKAFTALAKQAGKKGAADQGELIAAEDPREPYRRALRRLVGRTWWTKAEFVKDLLAALATERLVMSAPVEKAIMAAVSVPDPEGEIQTDKKGNPLPDPDLRDYENVPLGEDVDEYLKREVLPHVPDAWVDHSKTKIGYEIPFTRHFYVYKPPRPLEEIDAEIKQLEAEIQKLLGEVTG
ncbi:restriction endonuclease subunit M [Carbonactinospora thermoautotrophica]|uniref:site-specific DNA-methyltransferase (adenine-specific) n=1 Tax=Carbonactinospora thermoautotrophica TaxID=1469144 RepID=A0A132NB74_9ACTN|nr:class I SAM-dependent DNA methyltransferase [Carbonactinospora thermoautotrophica]KWX05762.1 restriction endonuclease subunit M [Carbonactinospora thermoautotrophica]KWX07290.1 restriction endonuclease subunit M [Carbonactinospora thermoautotrophica]